MAEDKSWNLQEHAVDLVWSCQIMSPQEYLRNRTLLRRDVLFSSSNRSFFRDLENVKPEEAIPPR